MRQSYTSQHLESVDNVGVPVSVEAKLRSRHPCRRKCLSLQTLETIKNRAGMQDERVRCGVWDVEHECIRSMPAKI